MKRSSFIYGSLIVAFSSMFIRLISFSYQVYLVRAIGAEGIGIFHMLRPIFMIGLTITTSGLPTAISRLVSKSKASNDNYRIRRSFKTSLVFVIGLSIIIGIILYFSADLLCTMVFGHAEYTHLILLLIPAIVFISVNSLFRGLLYGLNKMFKASVSELIEHSTRFVIVILLVLFVIPQKSTGIINIAFIGISIGDFFALIYLYRLYQKLFPDKYTIITRSISRLKVLRQLLRTSLSPTFLKFSRLLSQFVTATMLPKMLMQAGFSQLAATETFGRIMGMAIPIVFIPFLFTSALVVNIIPSISHQLQQKKPAAIKNDIKLALKLVLAVSIPLSLAIFAFGNNIGLLLYKDMYVGSYIKTLSLSIVFISINHVLYGILYGLGQGKAAAANRIAGMLIQLSTIFTLVPNPQYNIHGFLYGFIASAVLTFLLDLRILKKKIPALF